jgi:predicted PurR-regulated permease PerM
MARTTEIAALRRSVGLLTGTVLTAGVLAALYWGHSILIPFALALFLTFLLSPLTSALQRWGLARIPAVAIAILLAASVIVAVGWIVTGEIGNLLAELPGYSQTLQTKIRDLRSTSGSSIWDRLNKMMDEIKAAWKNPDGSDQPPTDSAPPLPVVVAQDSPVFPQWLQAFLPPVADLLTQGGLVLVMAIFMLLDREAMRNRFVRLIGHGHTTTSTQAVDETTRRISRFLLMQLAVNTCYGIAFGIGLALIGIEHAPLWGFLAGLFRYVPYFGAPAAALLPLAISLVQKESWLAPLSVLGWFCLLEGLANGILEPLFYGRSTGVSALALLAAAAFWAFFWGPIGLVLSCPLTVCLAVLGKYVPSLKFLAVMLSDQPALKEFAAFYQRLSAGDLEEAKGIATAYVSQHTPNDVFDAVFVPALSAARRDWRNRLLTDHALHVILQTMREVLARMEATSAKDSNNNATDFPPAGKAVPVVSVAARDEIDAVGVEMMRVLLDPAKWSMAVVSTGALPSDIVAVVDEHQASMVFLGAIQPGNVARMRYMCKQLRKLRPELRIAVGLWNPKGVSESIENRLFEAGANRIESTLLGLRAHLLAWLPVLKEHETLRQPQAETPPGPSSGTALAINASGGDTGAGSRPNMPAVGRTAVTAR